MNKFELKKRPNPDDLLQAIVTAVGFALLVWLIIMCAGCKTQKNTYHYDGTDYAAAKDSTAQAGHTEQTAATSSADSSAIAGTITFAGGGGTVTAGGVELTNVQTIDGSIFAGGQVFHVEHYIHDTTTVVVRDTVTVTKVEVEKVEKKTTATPWYLFIICYICGVATVVALKKIPQTRPFMAWL